MGDKFTINVSTGSLSAAESRLGDLARNVEEEGTKLGALPDKAASWTGGTAKTLKAEMTRIAGQMKSAPEHFNTAKTAVSTFRGKLEEAQTKTLPDLNRRWTDTVTAYDEAVSKANQAYGETVRPYRNMPPEDVGTARKDAGTTRDNAIGSAESARNTAQSKLQGEYDGLIQDLQAAATTCGSALAAAVLVAVPAEVISSYLSGGGMGPGALDANFDKATRDARQKLTGDESLVGRSDDLKAGTELGNSIRDKVKKGQPLTAEEIAFLKANAKNAAFVEGFMTTMGPEALAALSFETLADVDSPNENDRKAARELKDALTDMYTTGSHIQVDDGHGGQRYLMDDGWLNKFNPKGAWPDQWNNRYAKDGYAPAILLPFLTKPLSENFSKVVGDRWLRDYEAYRQGKNINFYNNYRTIFGGKDLTNTVFDRIADHPNVSNDLMTAHLNTFNFIMTGKDSALIGGSNDTDIRNQLNKILHGAVLDIDPNDTQRRSNADYILAGMGKYLADPANKNPKLIKEVLPALGDIMVSPLYLQGQIMSVATPFAPDFDPKAGFPAYSRDPNMGLLMDPVLWEQLQQEALRRPENVTSMLGATRDWVDAQRRNSDGRAYTFDPDHLGPDGQPIPPYSSEGNYSVVALDLYQQEAVRSFLGKNLLAVRGDLEAEMEKRMEDAGKPAEYGKAALGKIMEWAADPAAAPKDIATAGVGLAIDAAFGAYTKDQQEQIKADYNKQIGALDKSIDPAFTNPGFWDDTDTTTDNLAANFDPRRTPPSVWAEGDQAKGGPVIEYTGDPKQYVGHKSEYVGGGGNPVITDDFLEYGDNGEVTGVMDPKDMNHLQREAYLNWLHDPAVQSHLDGSVDAVGTARERAGK